MRDHECVIVITQSITAGRQRAHAVCADSLAAHAVQTDRVRAHAFCIDSSSATTYSTDSIRAHSISVYTF
jgi:hypothetical protein